MLRPAAAQIGDSSMCCSVAIAGTAPIQAERQDAVLVPSSSYGCRSGNDAVVCRYAGRVSARRRKSWSTDIRKLRSGQCRLYREKLIHARAIVGTSALFASRAEAQKHERAVQFFNVDTERRFGSTRNHVSAAIHP